MTFVAAAVLLIAFGMAYDRWRSDRWMNRWIDEHFGKDISSADRLKIAALYFPNRCRSSTHQGY